MTFQQTVKNYAGGIFINKIKHLSANSLEMNFNPHTFCDYLTTTNGHHMMPHFFLQFFVMSAAVIFAVLVIGFLVILDRARLTNVVRARQSFEPTVEELFLRAVSQYERMNNN